MKRKELRNVVIQVVDRVLNIYNGYCPEDYIIFDNGHEFDFCRESEELKENDVVVYRIDAEGLNSHLDPVIEEIEELCELGDLEQLHQIATDITDCYIDCDDEFYRITEYETEEETLKELLSEF
jgi:hypothetical protein